MWFVDVGFIGCWVLLGSILVLGLLDLTQMHKFSPIVKLGLLFLAFTSFLSVAAVLVSIIGWAIHALAR